MPSVVVKRERGGWTLTLVGFEDENPYFILIWSTVSVFSACDSSWGEGFSFLTVICFSFPGDDSFWSGGQNIHQLHN